MKKNLLTLIILFISLNLPAHPWKPSHYVIIDTDGGIDDMRAVTMLLASPDVRVLAITVSPGALSATNAYIKVRSLLNSFYHEGIPVGVNRICPYRSNDFLIALESKWGTESGLSPVSAPDCITLISDILRAEKTKFSFISLGSMSTAFHALREIPAFKSQVKDFIWSADGASDVAGFNYSIDRESSVKILKQEIPVKVVRSFKLEEKFYSPDFIQLIREAGSSYAKKISSYFDTPAVKEHPFSYSATDDMVPLFLHYPALFINKTAGNVSDCTPADTEGLRSSMLKIIKGATVEKNQVLRSIPADPSFYADDIGPSVTAIITSHGMDEWTSGVLANELHRHLGVFAIVGVKMGIRAREYFNTGVDEFRALSYAGSVPPLSCMNDGLQVSTGATPGHGLLSVRNDTILSPTVDFTYLNRRIRLTLKPEIARMITSELKEISYVYGLDSNIYWELVRKNSVKYWLNLDRHDIFTIEELK